jgi:hypothetical protein
MRTLKQNVATTVRVAIDRPGLVGVEAAIIKPSETTFSGMASGVVERLEDGFYAVSFAAPDTDQQGEYCLRLTHPWLPVPYREVLTVVP